MILRRRRVPALVRSTATCLALACAACGGTDPALITVDPARTFQVISGWEANAQMGGAAATPAMRDSILTLAADLGITRLRVEAKSAYENTTPPALPDGMAATGSTAERCGRYFAVNDNDDPETIDWSGFRFASLDSTIENAVLPLAAKLEARGGKLYLNVNYVSFILQCGGDVAYVHEDPREYAEFALATFLHLRDRYGLVPDAWEMILEPDNSRWRGETIGRALVETARVLEAHGFRPEFIAPSNTNMATAITDFDAMVAVPGVLGRLSEFSYHRYGGVSDDNLRAIAERGARYGVRTSMLEHMGSGQDDLHDDLVLANASAWQQFTLAYPTKDNGAQYFIIDGSSIRMGSRTGPLGQYFRHVRPGAVRLDATTTDAAFAPVAFRNEDGSLAVIVKTDRAGRIRVAGLPAGRWEVTYATAETPGHQLPAIAVADGDTLTAEVPAGVTTLHN
jgi:hypothetical protein